MVFIVIRCVNSRYMMHRRVLIRTKSLMKIPWKGEEWVEDVLLSLAVYWVKIDIPEAMSGYNTYSPPSMGLYYSCETLVIKWVYWHKQNFLCDLLQSCSLLFFYLLVSSGNLHWIYSSLASPVQSNYFEEITRWRNNSMW